MFIQTQDTPNPQTVKFLPGVMLLDTVAGEDFSNVQEACYSPLAQRLFALNDVVRVFIGQDFVSVSKANEVTWAELKPLVLAALMEHLSTQQPIIDEEMKRDAVENKKEAALDDPIVAQIVQLLDERVRPMVARDGGEIVFDRFEDGVVYLHMRGACSGCPSAAVTLKTGIESMLRQFIPEVIEVRPASGL